MCTHDKGTRDFFARHRRPDWLFVFTESAAFGGKRASKALWVARKANGGSQFHQCLIEIAWTCRLDERVSKGPYVSFGCSMGRSFGSSPSLQSAQYAFHISTDHCNTLAMSDAGDRGRSVGTDSGKIVQSFGGRRQDTMQI